MANNTYRIEYAVSGRAQCKETTCKRKIVSGELRVGKTFPSDRFTEGGMSTDWYHVPCIFKSLRRARKNTKKIESEDDIENLDSLSAEDKNFVLKCLAISQEGGELPEPSGAPAPAAEPKPKKKTQSKKQTQAKTTTAKSKGKKSKTVYRVRLLTEDSKAIYLSDGSKFLGRGDETGVTDKKCSRKQVELIMDSTAQTVTLVLHGSNPIVFTRGDEKKIVEKGGKVSLQNGDEFTLLGQQYPLTIQTRVDTVEVEEGGEEEEEEAEEQEVKPLVAAKKKKPIITEEEEEEKPETTTTTATKRKQPTPPSSQKGIDAEEEEEIQQPQQKKAKHELPPQKQQQAKPKPKPKPAPKKKKADKEAISLKKQMGVIDSDDDGQPDEYDMNDGFLVPDDDPIIDFDDDDDDEYKEARDIDDDDEGGGRGADYVGGKPKCWYGANCYQKNPKHLASFWHPPKHKAGGGGGGGGSPMKNNKGGGGGDAGKSNNDDTVAQVLAGVFKDVDLDVIKAVLKAKNGNMNDTIEFLKSTSSTGGGEGND